MVVNAVSSIGQSILVVLNPDEFEAFTLEGDSLVCHRGFIPGQLTDFVELPPKRISLAKGEAERLFRFFTEETDDDV